MMVRSPSFAGKIKIHTWLELCSNEKNCNLPVSSLHCMLKTMAGEISRNAHAWDKGTPVPAKRCIM
jgi:hypothetical protein